MAIRITRPAVRTPGAPVVATVLTDDTTPATPAPARTPRRRAVSAVPTTPAPAPKATTPKGKATPAPKGKATPATPAPLPKRTTADAVNAILAFGRMAEQVRAVAGATESAFTHSATTTHYALAAGASALGIARAVKVRTDAGEIDASLVYTSDVSVGFHALTGAYLLLPGDAPTELVRFTDKPQPMAPESIQALIKKVGQTLARPAVEGAKDKGSAHRALLRALASKPKATPKAGAVKGKGTGPKDGAPATTASLVTSALPILAGALKAGPKGKADRDAIDLLVKATEALVSAWNAANAAPATPARKARARKAA